MKKPTYTHREVELFQLWAKRTEVEKVISELKSRLIALNTQVRKIQTLVNKERKK